MRFSDSSDFADNFILIILKFNRLFHRGFETRLADALEELQRNTVEMERNRVVPELIGLYNAETEVHRLLPHSKYTTKLIGTHNKRVITAFNPSDSIQLLLDNTNPNMNAIDGNGADVQNELAAIPASSRDARKTLDEPLHWDQNWTWDY